MGMGGALMFAGRPLPLVLKFADWPAQDRAAWNAALEDEGPFSQSGAFAHLREGTLKRYRQDYGHWLSFIARNHPALLDAAPAQRVSEPVVREFIEETSNRPSCRRSKAGGVQLVSFRTLANHLQGLHTVMRAFNAPQDLSWLKLAARRIYILSDPYSLKPPIPLSASEVRTWALSRLAEVHGGYPADPIARAVAFRQALSIGLLISAPERLRAFSGLTVAQVVFPDADRVRIDFPGEDTKNNKDRSIPVQGTLVLWLRIYLDHYRNVLLRGASSDALWIGRDGVPLTYDGFGSGLELVMEREFGIRLRPHAFRTISASSTAAMLPEQVGIIREILGHATLEMAERHYIRVSNVRACRSYQEVVTGIRKGGASKRSGKVSKK